MNHINEFFRDKQDNIKYNDFCLECPYNCKQSFRAHIFMCKHKKELSNKKGKKK